MMIVILDRGHGQKGTSFDPGVVSGQLREVDLTREYIRTAQQLLTRAGHQVHLIDTGTYDARHREAMFFASAEASADALYIQCHVNAGGGKYGLVEHDARSSWGRMAAAALADALDELPETPTVRLWPIDSGDRGWACIDDIYASPTMCGLIYEPGFIDTFSHSSLWTAEGLHRVGGALAAGVERYASQLAARRADGLKVAESR